MVTTVYSYNHEIFKESKTASQTLKLSAPERFVILEMKTRFGAIPEAAALVQERGGDRPEQEQLAVALFDGVRVSLTNAPTLRPREESLFARQGDYWTIQYQGQVAHLKATRGLHCLSCLLRHPDRKFRVCELIADFLEVPVMAAVASNVSKKEDGNKMRTVRFEDVGPLLDAHAKADYAADGTACGV